MPVKTAVRKVDKVVECIQYTIDNIEEIDKWVGMTHVRKDISNPITMLNLGQKFQDYIELWAGMTPLTYGDYIVKMDGCFFLWKEDIFKERYEIIES